MAQIIDLQLPPHLLDQREEVIKSCAQHLRLFPEKIDDFRILKRSVDARRKPAVYRLRVEVFMDGESIPEHHYQIQRKQAGGRRVAIVGSGPAGLFAALRLLEDGLQPVVFERGKDVRSRRRDLAAIHKEQKVHPHSNYCFGEGGAGTYSDGKLYTRSKKRGDVRKILEVLVEHGAEEDILVDAHPHIGTNKLPQLITNIRNTILNLGGEIHFEHHVEGILIEDQAVCGLIVNGAKHEFQDVILATGHSARDVFEMLHKRGVHLEFKPFALGVRVEHPQSLIDRRQYRCETRPDSLPPAAYSLVSQVEGKGVYSFCMCPGGIIAPCATEDGEVVTNGWSPSKRNNPFANSGIVVPVDWEDVSDFHDFGPLAGVAFQRSVERACCEATGGLQMAPAQRLVDFVKGRKSDSLPTCSYSPGVVSVRVDRLLPNFISSRLKTAFVEFDKKIRGFMSPDAIVVAPESRTSSPVRIPRDKETMCHVDIAGLYPAGEGAGYAGGIVSAAVDGEQIARVIVEKEVG